MKISTVCKIIFLILSMYYSSYVRAVNVIPEGRYALIIASRTNLSDAIEYMDLLPDKRFVNIYEFNNGRYAISLGFLYEDELYIANKWKIQKKIPNDSFVDDGSKIIREISYDEIDNARNNKVISSKPIYNKYSCNKREEITACYAVVFGPLMCSKLISEKYPEIEKSFYTRYGLNVACSEGVNSVFARSNLSQSLIDAFIDEALDSSCKDWVQDRTSGISSFFGGIACAGNYYRWMDKISGAKQCARKAEIYCN